MSENAWTLHVMDDQTAEPVAVLQRPFTRFEMRRMEAAVRALEHWGTTAKYTKERKV